MHIERKTIVTLKNKDHKKYYWAYCVSLFPICTSIFSENSTFCFREKPKNEDIRNVVASFVALALIPGKDSFLEVQKSKNQLCECKMKKKADFVSFLEVTWFGDKLFKRDKLLPLHCPEFSPKSNLPKKCSSKPTTHLKKSTVS